MADKTWKRCERDIAKRLNGKRVGPSGKATADVVTNRLAVEVKHRKSLPAWIWAAMGQAVGAAMPSQLPIVVLHELGEHHDNDTVLIRLQDFVRLMGDLKWPEVTEVANEQGQGESQEG